MAWNVVSALPSAGAAQDPLNYEAVVTFVLPNHEATSSWGEATDSGWARCNNGDYELVDVARDGNGPIRIFRSGFKAATEQLSSQFLCLAYN